MFQWYQESKHANISLQFKQCSPGVETCCQSNVQFCVLDQIVKE